MKDDYTTNSRYLTHTSPLQKVGRMYFLNLGVKGLIINFCQHIDAIAQLAPVPACHPMREMHTTLTEKTWNLIYEVLRRNWPKSGPKSRSLFRKASALDFSMYFSCVALFVIKNEEERA